MFHKRKMASEYDDLKALRRGLRYQLSEVLLTQVKARLPMKSGSDRRVKLLLVTAYSRTPVIWHLMGWMLVTIKFAGKQTYDLQGVDYLNRNTGWSS